MKRITSNSKRSRYKCAIRKIPISIQAEIAELIDGVCQLLNLEFDCVIKKNRSRECVDARYIIVERIRTKFDKKVPYSYIGQVFNRKSSPHIYAIQAERWCKDLLATDKKFKEKHQMIVNSIP